MIGNNLHLLKCRNTNISNIIDKIKLESDSKPNEKLYNNGVKEIKRKQNEKQNQFKFCTFCGSSELSFHDGVVCVVCGSVVARNFVSSAEETSVIFNNCSNRKSAYTSYNDPGSSYKLQSCITGGNSGKYGGKHHSSQKNYQEETRLKNIKYIKQKLVLLPHISKSICDQAIRCYLEFKIAGNTNRAQINKGIICAFVKRAALNDGIELTNKKLNEVFEVDIKHITKGIQIIIDAGYCINYDINALIINYIKYNFKVLQLPNEEINKGIFLALFINKYMSNVLTSFIPHSICAWVTFYLIISEDINVGINKNDYKPHIYASKVKAIFDSSQPTVRDKIGQKREHIVSNVNITKIDRIMITHKEKLCSILKTCKSRKSFKSIKSY